MVKLCLKDDQPARNSDFFFQEKGEGGRGGGGGDGGGERDTTWRPMAATRSDSIIDRAELVFPVSPF